jgi:ParB/RepB/Spo0J family partition protein
MSESGRLVLMQVAGLKPHPKNPSEITEEAVRKLADSMQTYGFTTPIEIQGGTNVILAGHRRFAAAKLLGLSLVPCIVHDMGDDEALAYLIANNQHAKDHKWAKPQLADAVIELEQLGYAPDTLGFSEKDVARLFDLDKGEEEEGEAAADAPHSYLLEGDVWEIGPVVFTVYNLDAEGMLKAEKLIEKIAKMLKAKAYLDGNEEHEFRAVIKARAEEAWSQ